MPKQKVDKWFKEKYPQNHKLQKVWAKKPKQKTEYEVIEKMYKHGIDYWRDECKRLQKIVDGLQNENKELKKTYKLINNSAVSYSTLGYIPNDFKLG